MTEADRPSHEEGNDEEEQLIERLVEARTTARSEQDYATADRIRDELADLGVEVQDRPDGAIWQKTS